MGMVNVFVNAAYAVNSDIKSHTGEGFFWRGAIIAKSRKQWINTTSSTIPELIRCSDVPSAIYARLFLQEQGYEIQTSTLHQDNPSTIRLLNNGRASAGNQSRHIDIIFFYYER